MPRKKYGEWISAMEALRLFEKTNGGRDNLKKSIAEFIRDDQLKVRGRVYRRVTGAKISEAWRSIAPKDPPESEQVSRSKFRASKRWKTDVSQWRWPQNRFSISYASKPRKRTLIDDVELNTADLKKLLNDPAPLKKGGQKIDLERWTDFMLASVQCAVDGKLNIHETPDQEKLRDEIAMRMKGEEFGETSMKAAVQTIWDKFIEPDREVSLIEAGSKVQ